MSDRISNEIMAGWKGISVRASTVEADDAAWVAVGTDQTDGAVAISVWEGDGPSRRLFAFWIKAEDADTLIAALAEAAKKGPDPDYGVHTGGLRAAPGELAEPYLEDPEGTGR